MCKRKGARKIVVTVFLKNNISGNPPFIFIRNKDE